MDFLLWMAGEGSICPGEEITILDKHKTTALGSRTNQFFLERVIGRLWDGSGEQVIKLAQSQLGLVQFA